MAVHRALRNGVDVRGRLGVWGLASMRVMMEERMPIPYDTVSVRLCDRSEGEL